MALMLMYMLITSELTSSAVTSPGLQIWIADSLLGILTCRSNAPLIVKMAKMKLLILVPTLKPGFFFPLDLPISISGTTIYSVINPKPQ